MERAQPLGPFLAVQPPDRGWHPGILPIARLKPGVTLQGAQTELAAIAARLEQAYPETNTRVAITATPMKMPQRTDGFIRVAS